MKTDSPLSRRSAVKQLAYLPVVGLSLQDALFKSVPVKKRPVASFIPVMVTPLKADLSIDWDQFDRVTDFYAAAGADGYFANCLSSEMYYLTPEERLAVTERVIKHFKGKKPVVSTGSFGDTLEEKANFVKQVYDLGVDAVILITGHFAEKNESDDILVRNLKKLAALTGNIPLGTYECPNPYKRVLSPEVFQYLAESKRFFYHKDTSENISNIRQKLGKAKGSDLKLFNAHTASAAASIREGGAGLSPISGNFYPEILSWLCKNATNPAKKADVDWIQAELAETEPLISKGYPVSSKYFLQKRGLPIEVATRLPRNPLTSAQKEVLDDVYKRFNGWCERLGVEMVRV